MNISEGCSACACGVAGACDVIIFPDSFGWVVFFASLALTAIISLCIAMYRIQKINSLHVPGKQTKRPKLIILLRIISIVLSGALILGSINYLSLNPIETAGAQTRRGIERCNKATSNFNCEY